MRLICPQCAGPIDVSGDTFVADVRCGNCGGTLDLVSAESFERRSVSESPSGQRMTSQVASSASAETDVYQVASAADGSEPSVDLPKDFGDYELLELLGQGGMGVVYRARQRSADRTVALKLIRADRIAHGTRERREDALQRFRLEAKAAARLDHDHVVTVYEVGELGGIPFYSMKHVEGQSLHAMLRTGPLENRQAARYLEAAALGVADAHRHGILHRDLKPHNLLVEAADDRVLVADFGLAKLVDEQSGVSLTGDNFGTPSYMAPEQAIDASRVTVLADVYGLGATLYHALTGRPPFQAASPVETLRQVIERPPLPPRALNNAVDRDLETICLKALDKSPERRYQSTADLAADLRRYQEARPITARRVSRLERSMMWCRRNPWLAALTTGLAAAVVLGTIGVAWQYAQASLARAERSTSLVDELVYAADNRVLTVLPEIDSAGGTQASERLIQLSRVQNLSRDHRLRITLALLPLDEKSWGQLNASLRNATPTDFCLIAGRLLQLQRRVDLTAFLNSLTDLLTSETRLLASRSGGSPRACANIAALLLILGRDELVWPLFVDSPDNSIRSALIENIAVCPVSPRLFVNRIHVESDVSARRALYLLLGSLSASLPDPREREQFAQELELVRHYREHPDPGVHAAIEWLLREWEMGDRIKSVCAELSGRVAPNRQWFVSLAGHTFGVYGPCEFWMGSPEGEPGRRAPIEHRHRRAIDRRFALALHEVTTGQFRRFRRPPRGGHDANIDELPVSPISWSEAAAYCNWLSAQEGIDPSAWCYVQGARAGLLVAAPDYLQRTGYRLPTEAEWEYCCRAGSATSRFFGESDEQMSAYAWWTHNTTEGRKMPVGTRKPNAFGMFDMYGNAVEWCNDVLGPYHREDLVLDRGVHLGDPPKCPEIRSLRGTAAGDAVPGRSAMRDAGVYESSAVPAIGFRVARTLPDDAERPEEAARTAPKPRTKSVNDAGSGTTTAILLGGRGL